MSETITVRVKKLGINGEGIAYYHNKIVFIPGALPKEKVAIQITKNGQKFSEGRLVKIFQKSPDRAVPPCPIYDTCGGCQLQHLNYAAQLDFKRDLLKQSLAKFKPAGYQDFKIKKTLGMEDPWRYRNKAQFQVRMLAGKPAAGLFQENSHRLVALTDCLVQMPITQEIINEVVNLLKKYPVPIFDEGKKSGVLKTLMVRTTQDFDEVQLVFITHTADFPYKKEIIASLTNKFPQLVSVMQNIQDTTSSKIFGDKTILLWGKATITEQLSEISFDLSARAFFQLNPAQTIILYDEVRKALQLSKNETLIDAYCGVGTIGLSLAHLAKEVRGMDTVPEAIADAKKNAQRKNLTNTRYEVGTAEKLIPKWNRDGFIPDAIVVDPPRTGLDDALLNTLLKFPVKKLVYVSCNISTLARDLKKLATLYEVDYLQSVDMFPQTARCEVVVQLRLKK
ncbi:23S rRNA (uracil(1939)-C(5))-methyltransferase RlmD [Enterococcus timonensis]|uniref:23S rRNA (uracil(1939)-C(5))-methyltransferase RlmD n=1 Tax=Enterococcus timonensis TaxID=1852364 RepID=UPI000AF0C2B1|nr:23S rRNA (uracil(1939)-C(5))-methyltransferase RlmD [Enterococcus timonensis]